MSDNKQEFLDLFRTNVTRRGADKLLEWLESTDFFSAPASTRFHAAYAGGLLAHSLNVYHVFLEKHYDPKTDDLESVTICTLLHDLCKAGFYDVEYRNRKNDEGVWKRFRSMLSMTAFPMGMEKNPSF